MNSDEQLRAATLRLGRGVIQDPWDRIARYCGLQAAGDSDGTVGFRYYDSVGRKEGRRFEALDPLTATAIHPVVTREDLRWFHDEREHLDEWLNQIDREETLTSATPEMLRTVAELATWDTPIDLVLLSKVLHRARPRSIPIIDRPILERYQLDTHHNTVNEAWPALLIQLREDIGLEEVIWFVAFASKVKELTFERLDTLRLLDIVLWMEGRP